MTTFVIVGGGLAGAKAAETLRAEGFTGEIVLFGDESEVPYERPPLSKDYLLGKKPRESAYVHPAEWYAENSVDLRTGVSVAAIERPTHTVIVEPSAHGGASPPVSPRAARSTTTSCCSPPAPRPGGSTSLARPLTASAPSASCRIPTRCARNSPAAGGS